MPTVFILNMVLSVWCCKKLFWLHYGGWAGGQETEGRETSLKSLEIIWVKVSRSLTSANEQRHGENEARCER